MLGHRFPNPIIGVVGPFPDHRSCNFGTIIFNKYLTTTGFGRELRQDRRLWPGATNVAPQPNVRSRA